MPGDHRGNAGEFAADGIFGGHAEVSESFLTDNDVFFSGGVMNNDGRGSGGLDDEFGDGRCVFLPFDAIDFLATSGAGEGVNAGHETESFSS
ncbi:MAG: hypothetical protein RL215_576 [Planctomycetota bacterium]